ncbi:hypothetical protein EMCRGX_G006817 [Ephydatia muelleri]
MFYHLEGREVQPGDTRQLLHAATSSHARWYVLQSLPGHSSPALITHYKIWYSVFVTLSDLDASVRSCFQSEEGCCCIVQ